MRKVGTNVNPADLMKKNAGKAEDRAAHGHHGLRIHGGCRGLKKKVDRQERDDVLATWRSKKSGTMVASSVLRDSSSGDDVVRDC